MNGKSYLESLGYKCSRISYKRTHVERQKIISSFAARYYENQKVQFIPSIDIKDKHVFTITSRRYIGVLKINKIEYLTYYISKNQTKQYVQNIVYDIRKERKYRQVIVFVEDIKMVDIEDFVFGMDKLYIIPYTEENIKLLENIHSIDYARLFEKEYKEKVYLSEYDDCDYYTKTNRYIFEMPFIDAEKLTSIKYFLQENEDKDVDIVYSKNISILTIGKFKKVDYKAVDFSKYVKGEYILYE